MGFDRLRRSDYLILTTAIIIFVVLVFSASPSVRGSDQYWYVADVATLAEGQGPITNNTFPPSVLPVMHKLPRPFVHNIPNVYMLAPLAVVFGAHHAWVVGNLLATLWTGFLIFLIVAPRAGQRLGVLAALIWLALPVTFWQATQPLAEATMAPFVALAVVIFVRPQLGSRDWLALVMVATFLTLCRTSMAVLLPLVGLAFVLRDRQPVLKRVILLVCMAGLSLACIGAWYAFAEPNLKRGALDFLRSGVPGATSNMAPFLELNSGPLTVGMLIHKVLGSIRMQFLAGPAERIFFLPVNLLMAILILLKLRQKQWLAIDFAAFAFMALHFMTIAVFQNQFRYMLTMLPALIPAVIIAAHEAGWFTRRWATTAMVASLLAIILVLFAPLAWLARKDALREARVREALSSAITGLVLKGDRVMVEAKGPFLLVGYVLKPNPVLFVDSDYRADQYESLSHAFGAQWMLCKEDSAIVHKLKGQNPVALNLPAPLQHLILIRCQ